MLRLASAAITVMVLIGGCVPDYPDYDPDYGCKTPVYMSYAKLREKPDILSPRDIKKTGKIYIYNDLLFVNEPNVGIHVIDNSNTHNPKKLSFIDLPGNIDIAVKDGYLYADSFMDLVVLDVHNINNITKAKRVNEVFMNDSWQILGDSNINYCNIEPDRGVIVGYKD